MSTVAVNCQYFVGDNKKKTRDEDVTFITCSIDYLQTHLHLK